MPICFSFDAEYAREFTIYKVKENFLYIEVYIKISF